MLAGAEYERPAGDSDTPLFSVFLPPMFRLALIVERKESIFLDMMGRSPRSRVD